MARLIIIAVITIIALMCTNAQEYYSDKYDDINTLDILNNEKLQMQYYKCFMDLEPCVTADAKFFKGMSIECIISHFLTLLGKKSEAISKCSNIVVR